MVTKLRKEREKCLPGFSSTIRKASIAAVTQSGGCEAEKQYPRPDSL